MKKLDQRTAAWGKSLQNDVREEITIVCDELEDCKQWLVKNERDKNLQSTCLPLEVWDGKAVQEGQGLAGGTVKMPGDIEAVV